MRSTFESYGFEEAHSGPSPTPQGVALDIGPSSPPAPGPPSTCSKNEVEVLRRSIIEMRKSIKALSGSDREHRDQLLAVPQLVEQRLVEVRAALATHTSDLQSANSQTQANFMANKEDMKIMREQTAANMTFMQEQTAAKRSQVREAQNEQATKLAELTAEVAKLTGLVTGHSSDIESQRGAAAKGIGDQTESMTDDNAPGRALQAEVAELRQSVARVTEELGKADHAPRADVAADSAGLFSLLFAASSDDTHAELEAAQTKLSGIIQDMIHGDRIDYARSVLGGSIWHGVGVARRGAAAGLPWTSASFIPPSAPAPAAVRIVVLPLQWCRCRCRCCCRCRCRGRCRGRLSDCGRTLAGFVSGPGPWIA